MKFNRVLGSFQFAIAFITCTFILSLLGCKKFVEVDPPIDRIGGSVIFNSNATASSAILGIYTQLSNGLVTGRSGIPIITGLSGDELVPVTHPQEMLTIAYLNGFTNNGDVLFWTDLYRFIFYTNSALEGLKKSNGVTDAVKKQLMAEAKFVRGFMYFYLCNLYGDVPLILTTDPSITSLLARSPKAMIYDQIIMDLNEAAENLNVNYVGADGTSISTERVRPNRSTALALLSKVYLYSGKWELAENEATKVISNTGLYELESLERVFLIGSKEAIWQLQSTRIERNTLEAELMILAPSIANNSGGPNDAKPVYLSNHLLNSFSRDDRRRKEWMDSIKVLDKVYSYAYKYKAHEIGPRTENLIIFRLADLYLIRSEARAHLGKIAGPESALSDINMIRSRAGIPDLQNEDQAKMLNDIYKERQLELFTEGGNRWMDLRRTGRIDAVMSMTNKGNGQWESFKSLFPIPAQEFRRNPNLKGHQNPGYPEQ